MPAVVKAAGLLVLAALVVAPGCSTSPPRTAIPVAPPRGAEELPLGAWRVKSFRFVGVSALSPKEAGAWIGRLAIYSHAMAGFPPDTCAGTPGYTSSVANVADVAHDYHVRPSDVGFPRALVQLVEVRCDGGWSGPGARLYVLGPDRLVTVWDGVFFELAREPSP